MYERSRIADKEHRLLSHLFLMMPLGQPPLIRGILEIIEKQSKDCRLTPAHTGNISSDGFVLRAHMDHPRIRGEYIRAAKKGRTDVGSPPLMRGIFLPREIEEVCGRLTPAHTGNIRRVQQAAVCLKTHPRIRGEYIPDFLRSSMCLGSPPLMRGI